MKLERLKDEVGDWENLKVSVNRRCTNTNSFEDIEGAIKSCVPFEIKITGALGMGTFGKVYSGIAYHNGIPVDLAIKVISENLTSADFEMLNREITYSYNMGALGLGPVVYDAFYVVDNKDRYKQVIIMKYYKYNGEDALAIANEKQAADIVAQMIELTKEMIFVHKLYCTDIKPGNFVVDGKLKVVKMIDFGAVMCPQKLMTKTENELFQLMVFQIYFLIFINKKIRFKSDNVFRQYFYICNKF